MIRLTPKLYWSCLLVVSILGMAAYGDDIKMPWTVPGKKVSIIFIGEMGTYPHLHDIFKQKAEKRFPNIKFFVASPYAEFQNIFRWDADSLGYGANALSAYLSYPPADARIFVVDTSAQEDPADYPRKMRALSYFCRMIFNKSDTYICFMHKAGISPKVRNTYGFIAAYHGIPEAEYAMRSAKSFCDTLISEMEKKWPAPYINHSAYHRGMLFDYSRAEYDRSGWLDWQLSPTDFFMHILVGYLPGKDLVLKFSGTAVGIMGILDSETADILYSIDGGPYIRKELEPRPKNGFRIFQTALAECLPGGQHELRIQLPANEKRKIKIGKLYIAGTPVSTKPVLSKLDDIDKVYESMPPVKFANLHVNSQGSLPKTARLLKEAKNFTIVMLGDSIIEDTASSQFQLLLEKKYKSKITIIRSTRGGTGVGFFADHLPEYVLKHSPALVIAGGISSTSGDYRKLIPNLKKAYKGDILILPQTWGGVMLTTYAKNKANLLSRELMDIAKKEDVAFFDMLPFYTSYFEKNQLNVKGFMRDVVHHNGRGIQLLGRLLVEYLNEEVNSLKK